MSENLRVDEYAESPRQVSDDDFEEEYEDQPGTVAAYLEENKDTESPSDDSQNESGKNNVSSTPSINVNNLNKMIKIKKENSQEIFINK